MQYLNSLSPQTVTLLSVLASLAAIIGLLAAFYQPFKDLFGFINRKKPSPAQPKLAMNLVNGSRMRGRANDIMYHPFELNEDRVITWEQQQLLSFDWNLRWNFTLKITNQTEYPAYNTQICPFPHEEQFVKMHLTPSIDPTVAFKPHETKEFEVVCNFSYRAKPEEADDIIKNYPFKELRIEYMNTSGRKFATTFSTVEPDAEKRNRYEEINSRK